MNTKDDVWLNNYPIKIIYNIFFLTFLLIFTNCNNNIQRGNTIKDESFGELIFKFNAKGSKLSDLNPNIKFKGSENLEVDSDFSKRFEYKYDFIIDLKLEEMNYVSIKLKPGEYYGYFELDNTKIRPLWISRFSLQEVYFGFDAPSQRIFSDKKLVFYNENECTKNSYDELICPKIKIEAGKKYNIQFELEEEKFDGKTTFYLWIGTPLFIPMILNTPFIPPNILFGASANKQEIKVKLNETKK